VQLHPQAANKLTKITQVPASQGDSGLSTRSVDKSVHGGFAPRREEPISSMRTGLAKKTPNRYFLFESLG
jgi:hypothetical protein